MHGSWKKRLWLSIVKVGTFSMKVHEEGELTKDVVFQVDCDDNDEMEW